MAADKAVMRTRGAAALGFSVALHTTLWLVMPRVQAMQDARSQLQSVEVEVREIPAPADTPTAAAATATDGVPAAPATKTAARGPQTANRSAPAGSANPAPANDDAPPPDPSEPEPVNFDNVTLTNQGGAWSAPAGSGVSASGPLGPAPTRGNTRVRRGGSGQGTAGGGGGQGTTAGAAVPLAQLSRPPRPPNLNAALEKNYPSAARAQGVEGVVVVKAQIRADGRIGTLRLASESVRGYGFAAACRKTLRGSRWSPPLDAKGRPVTTVIRYRCDFRVRY